LHQIFPSPRAALNFILARRTRLHPEPPGKPGFNPLTGQNGAAFGENRRYAPPATLLGSVRNALRKDAPIKSRLSRAMKSCEINLGQAALHSY
jgi:hypothetical protein